VVTVQTAPGSRPRDELTIAQSALASSEQVGVLS
jgi:hypothetical protein